MNSLPDDVLESIVRFLTGTSSYSAEMQAFWMAIQGAVAIRNGPNKDKKMNWFHSFVLSVIAGYGGGLLGFIWMGKPSSMLSNDLNMGACIVAWWIVNCIPFDLGLILCNSLPIVLVTTSFAQLFRCTAIIRFIKVCFNDFKGTPSAYYPIPVFGPILYATLLGNMSGLVLKGLDGHFSNGIPWPFQNGLVCGAFYHFYVHDKTGPIGNALRMSFPVSLFVDLDDETFAACTISIFMQVMGILQLPYFFGPSFSPFHLPINFSSATTSTTKSEVGKGFPSSVNNPATAMQLSKPSTKRTEQSSNDTKMVLPSKTVSTTHNMTNGDEMIKSVENNIPNNGDTIKKKKRKKKKQS